MFLPPLLCSCESLQISPDIQSYLNHFQVTPQMLQKVISEAMSKGGDYSDLFFQHRITNYLVLQDGKVNRAYSEVDYGVGVRTLKGDQTGYEYTESTILEDMQKVAKTASNIANDPMTFKQQELMEKLPPNYYKVLQKWENPSVEQKIPFVQKMNDMVFELDEKVSKATVYQIETID